MGILLSLSVWILSSRPFPCFLGPSLLLHPNRLQQGQAREALPTSQAVSNTLLFVIRTYCGKTWKKDTAFPAMESAFDFWGICSTHISTGLGDEGRMHPELQGAILCQIPHESHLAVISPFKFLPWKCVARKKKKKKIRQRKATCAGCLNKNQVYEFFPHPAKPWRCTKGQKPLLWGVWGLQRNLLGLKIAVPAASTTWRLRPQISFLAFPSVALSPAWGIAQLSRLATFFQPCLRFN